MFISFNDLPLLKGLNKNSDKKGLVQKVETPFKFFMESQKSSSGNLSNSNNNKLSIAFSFINQNEFDNFIEENNLNTLVKPTFDTINTNSLSKSIQISPFNNKNQNPIIKNIDLKVKSDKNQEVRNTIFEVLKEVFSSAYNNTLTKNSSMLNPIKNTETNDTSLIKEKPNEDTINVIKNGLEKLSNTDLQKLDNDTLKNNTPLKIEVYKAINATFSFIKDKNKLEKPVSDIDNDLNKGELKEDLLSKSYSVLSELASKYKSNIKTSKNNIDITSFNYLYKINTDNLTLNNGLLPKVNTTTNQSFYDLNRNNEKVITYLLENSVDNNNSLNIDSNATTLVSLDKKDFSKVELFFDHILSSLDNVINLKDLSLEGIPTLSLNQGNDQIMSEVFDVLKEVFINENTNIKPTLESNIVATPSSTNEFELVPVIKEDNLNMFQEVFFELGKETNTLKLSNKDNPKVDLKKVEVGIKKLDALFINDSTENIDKESEINPSTNIQAKTINKRVFHAMMSGFSQSILKNSNLTQLEIKAIKNIFSETFKEKGIKVDFSDTSFSNKEITKPENNTINKLDDNTLVSSLLKKPEQKQNVVDNKANTQPKNNTITSINPKLYDNALVSSLLKKPEQKQDVVDNKANTQPKNNTITSINPKLYDNTLVSSLLKKSEQKQDVIETKPKVTDINLVNTKLDFKNQVIISKINSILKSTEDKIDNINEIPQNTEENNISTENTVKPRLDFKNQVTISKINTMLKPNIKHDAINEKTPVTHNIKYANPETNIINKKVEQAKAAENLTIVDIPQSEKKLLDKELPVNTKKTIKNITIETSDSYIEPTNTETIKLELEPVKNTIPNELKKLDPNKFDQMVDLFKNYFDSFVNNKPNTESKTTSLATMALLKAEFNQEDNSFEKIINNESRFFVPQNTKSKEDKITILSKPELKLLKKPAVKEMVSNDNIIETQFTNEIIDKVKPNKLDNNIKRSLEKSQPNDKELNISGKITPISKKQNLKNIDNNILTQVINSSEVIKYINNGTPIHFSQLPDVINDIIVNYISTEPIKINLTLKPINMAEVNVTFSLDENKMMSINFETSSLASQKIIQSYFQSIKEIVKDNSLALHELTATATMPISNKPIQGKSKSSFNDSSSNKDSDEEKGSFSSVRKRNKKRSSDDGDKEEIKVDI